MKGNTVPSGKFVLRIPPGLHALLRREAGEAGLSLNELCTLLLSAPHGSTLQLKAAAGLIRQAASRFGEKLLGVLVFGSWARGEAGPESDVDLLIVLDRRIPIRRSLYAQLDAWHLDWEGHSLEPHFVHLPKRRTSSIWAEAALDGIVLYERNFELSRRLVGIRSLIVQGRLLRRTAHGHPYWAEVA